QDIGRLVLAPELAIERAHGRIVHERDRKLGDVGRVLNPSADAPAAALWAADGLRTRPTCAEHKSREGGDPAARETRHRGAADFDLHSVFRSRSWRSYAVTTLA